MEKGSFVYQPIELDDELYLSDLPLDVLQDAMRTQFENPLEYRKKDYMQTFITKYEYTKENLDETEYFDIEQYQEIFMGFMIHLFEDILGVGFVDFENLSVEDQHDIMHIAYRFFIKGIKRNFVYAVLNYIDNNKDKLTELLDHKKDVTTLTFKTEIDDEFDILVLSNIEDVVDIALKEIEDSYDIDEFLNICEWNEPNLETEYVKKAYDNFEITGNFIEKYVSKVDSTFKTEIESMIRNNILKKYPTRTLKVSPEKEDEESDEKGDESDASTGDN